MRQVCQLGFNCPYHKHADEGDEICVYPYIFITPNDAETLEFGFPEDMDCPLLEYNSELDTILTAEDCEGFDEVLDSFVKKKLEETEKIYQEIRKRGEEE